MYMKLDTFEQYLQTKHLEVEPQVLDDDLPDAFNDWVAELDIDDLIKYGDAYGSYISSETLRLMKEAA